MNNRLTKPSRNRIVLAALAIIVAAVALPGWASPSGGTHGAKPAHGKLTFSHDVAAIIQKNCANCHHMGEVAPFPLVTYKDVAKRAQQIAIVTKSRFMPPWKA